MGFRTVLAMMLIAAGQVPVPDERPRPPADDLARALQQRYDGIRDFSADFVHTYQGGVLRRKATERGKVLIKKPGKMRWTYEAPEDKLFVSDGVKMYSYVPADRQVVVTTLPPDSQATSPALFLAGKGNLVPRLHGELRQAGRLVPGCVGTDVRAAAEGAGVRLDYGRCR